jgi:cytochrome P450
VVGRDLVGDVTAPTFDLDDPALLLRDEVLDDPRPLYRTLRRDAPVWRIAGQHTYLVTDPKLIREVVNQTSQFSSNLVSLLHRGDDGCPTGFELAPLGDPIHVLATADPPDHTRQRKLLQPHLSPASVAQLEAALRDAIDEQLAPMLRDAGGDVVARLSDPIPALAICLLLGLEPSDAGEIMPLVRATGEMLDGVNDLDTMGRAMAAAIELTTIAQARFDAVRATPRRERMGLLAVLVDALEDGQLSMSEVLGILMQLFNAGTETTSSLIANSVETIARNSALQHDLRREPEHIPEAIETVLRDDGPFQFHYRWTTVDTTIGGTSIPAGSRVLLMWAAANDVTDASTPHFAFGKGPHFCIGAPLARLEARLAIEQLLGSTQRVALDPDRPPTRRPSIMLRRHTSLNLVLDPHAPS